MNHSEKRYEIFEFVYVAVLNVNPCKRRDCFLKLSCVLPTIKNFHPVLRCLFGVSWNCLLQ